MMIRRWQPFDAMETLRRQIDRVFDEFKELTGERSQTWVPAIELQDTPENLILRALLPGVARNDVEIHISRESVSIAGERRYPTGAEDQGYFCCEFPYGRFQRNISLPLPVEHEHAKAEFCDGILTLTLPKSEEYRRQVVKINLDDTVEAASKTETAS